MKATQYVIEHLKENLDRSIKVDELSDIACLSSVQLYRRFKAKMGITPVQYHEFLRIKKGIELLQTDVQIRDVAYDLGYENYETFSRAFKKIVEIAPSDLQNIYFDFAEKASIDYALLVKQQANLYQINELIKESFVELPSEIDLEIYRLIIPKKGSWKLHRDRSTEKALAKIIL